MHARHTILVLVGTLLLAVCCGDDGSDDELGPCDEVEAIVEGVILAVCIEWPDCSLCDYLGEGMSEGEQPSDEECQHILDSWSPDEMYEGYSLLCEMEAGGDSDTDTDTDSDSDCDPPDDVTDWGEPCEPDGDDCPDDTYCITIYGLDDTAGYCAPLCCENDNSYCSDIGSGDEQCLVSNSQSGEWWCVVVCDGDEDCAPGTTCQEVASTNICYAAPPPDDEPCAGYTGDDPCCTNDNPCDWGLNDICDCDSTCAWDAVDCEW